MKRSKRFHRFTLPTDCHPLIIQLYHEMIKQRISPTDTEARAALSITSIKRWRQGQIPSLLNLQAAFNALGLELTVRKMQMENNPLGNAQLFAKKLREIWPECMQYIALHQMPETVALSIRYKRKSVNLLFSNKDGYQYSCLGDDKYHRYTVLKTIETLEEGIDPEIFYYLFGRHNGVRFLKGEQAPTEERYSNPEENRFKTIEGRYE